MSVIPKKATTAIINFAPNTSPPMAENRSRHIHNWIKELSYYSGLLVSFLKIDYLNDMALQKSSENLKIIPHITESRIQ